MQAASFWTFLCKRSCCMPAASLIKLDTTSQSWLVLPKTQGVTGYRCVCLSRVAQLSSWGLAVSLVSLTVIDLLLLPTPLMRYKRFLRQ